MTTTSSSSSTSQSTSFAGINDPQALAALQALIATLASGGTDLMKTQAEAKKAGIDQINTALGDYKKSAAFEDALDLVTSALDKALLAQKPAITRAVQGAGTSASAMQGLLATNAAEAASVQAGALGAEQAKAYGQITSSLLNTLMNATSTTDPAVVELIKALDLTKISTQQSTSSSNSIGTASAPAGTQGGGGTTRTYSSGGSGVSGGSGDGMGLFDNYNNNVQGQPTEDYVPQYSYDSSGAPVPTSVVGNTTTYGTDPYSSGYMSITNTTGNSSSDNSYDPYAGNYGYDEYADINFYA